MRFASCFRSGNDGKQKILKFFQNWLAIHWNACILNDIVFHDVLIEEENGRGMVLRRLALGAFLQGLFERRVL